jgi:hypothetical protein
MLASLISMILAVARRQKSFGGFLFYFYYWVFAIVFVYLADIVKHPRVFLPPYGHGEINHGALYLAVFPRLFAMIAVAAISIQLLRKMEWVYVETLRIVLLVALVISALSVWIDIRYFPKSVGSNGIRLVAMTIWLLYFCVSKRVLRVFKLRDWETSPGQALPLG